MDSLGNSKHRTLAMRY